MASVNPKVIAAGWAAASWIRALRAKWNDPRLDVDTPAVAAPSSQGRGAKRVATASKPAKKK
jgi:hypothetical protein